MTTVTGAAEQAPSRGALAPMALAALGVVYGDIGTSPLYTFKTAIAWAGGEATPAAALGMLSLIVWTLIITTSIKYVAIVMRADNDGEGGILALMSLLGIKHGERAGVIALGILGAALLRRRHHPGDFGAERARGHQDAVAGIRALRVAAVDLRSNPSEPYGLRAEVAHIGVEPDGRCARCPEVAGRTERRDGALYRAARARRLSPERHDRAKQ